MLNRFTSAFAALVLGLTGALVLGAPAQAAYSDCPSGMFCMWVDGNYSGARWQVSDATLIANHENANAVPAGWIDDEVSAVYNRSGVDIYVFDGYNCGSVGWRRLITNGQKLTAPGSAINDRISSVQRWGAYPLLCNLSAAAAKTRSGSGPL